MSDLNLSRIEVAAQIGVTENNFWNWEHGTEAEIKHMPKIIELLQIPEFHIKVQDIERAPSALLRA